jgi:2-hydroxy-3-keto-5-methylthiopentenyl-1-phosphate phosphatase
MCSRLVDLLVCDFDETITQNDTICEIANLAYEKRAETGKCPKPPNCPTLSSNDSDEECPPPWLHFVELYFKEYKEHVKRWCEQHSENTLQDHFKMLKSLKIVENKSIDRIEKHGCLKGVCYNDLVEKGKSIKKRDDVLSVLRKFISKKQPQNCENFLLKETNSTFTDDVKSHFERNLYIISTNWSKDLILGSLFELASENKFSKNNIFSNDLIFDNNCSVGELDRKVLSAIDKLEIFDQLNTSKSNLSVYIGDSDTDLPCLCEYLELNLTYEFKFNSNA